MADPSTYRPTPGRSHSPGCTRFRDEHRRVIYVGKAKSLRAAPGSTTSRTSANLHPRTQHDGHDGRVRGVDGRCPPRSRRSQLEYSWIKEFDPRFNVKYRDDKSYLLPRGDDERGVPRAQVMRGPKKKGVALLRPYGARLGDPRHRRPAAARSSRRAPARAGRLQERHARPAAPACSATSTSARRPASARDQPRRPPRRSPRTSATSMAGHTGTLRAPPGDGDGDGGRGDGVRARGAPARTTSAPARSAKAEERRGARRRHRRRRDRASPRTSWRRPSRSSTCAADGCAASAAGSPTRWRTTTTGALAEHALQQLYGEESARRRSRARSWCPRCPTPVRAASEWLTERARARGSRCAVPQRGDKKALMETVAAQRAAGARPGTSTSAPAT